MEVDEVLTSKETFLLRSDGTNELLHRGKLTLKEIQAGVQGYFEIVHLEKLREMLINEEGKIRGLPKNQLATEVFERVYGGGDYIVGDVIITMRKNL